ncbi:MAG TPA: glucose 1-dehydrogenase [Candidatus Rubrimentiphilum sp.]|nr:glucose 1-dehydrogenase [Candidatus Rubrimentiphilum sp.]
MDKALQGQVAVVTGAESGIGQSIAQFFGQSGASVIVNEFAYPDRARETVEAIERAGGRAAAVHADVTKERDVEKFFSTAEKEFGPVTILVNDAGISGEEAEVADLTLEAWNETLETNLTGPFLCARRYMQAYRDSKRSGGRIINITSVHETMPAIGMSAYCATKGGLMMFTRCLALEAAKYKITVNNIGPGTIMTPMNEDLAKNPQERKEHEKTIPIGRVGYPEDIGRVALFLASPQSKYMTGTTVFVDGGMLLNVASGPPQSN